MAGLTGLTPKDTYKKILIVSAASLNSALSRIRDGAGNASPIEMSTSDVKIVSTGKFMFNNANAYIFSDADDKLTIVSTRLKMSTPVSFKGRVGFDYRINSISPISAPSISVNAIKAASINLSAKIRATSVIGDLIGNITGKSTGRHVGSVSLNLGALNFDTSGNTRFDGATANTILAVFGGTTRVSWSVSDFEPAANGNMYLGRTNRWKGGKFVTLTASVGTVSTITVKAGVVNAVLGRTTPASAYVANLMTTGTVNLNSQELHMVNGGATKLKYNAGIRFIKSAASIEYTGTYLAPLDDQTTDLGTSGKSWGNFRCKAISAIEDVTFNKNVTMPSLPTSSSGLTAGMLYDDSGTIKIKQ